MQHVKVAPSDPVSALRYAFACFRVCSLSIRVRCSVRWSSWMSADHLESFVAAVLWSFVSSFRSGRWDSGFPLSSLCFVREASSLVSGSLSLRGPSSSLGIILCSRASDAEVLPLHRVWAPAAAFLWTSVRADAFLQRVDQWVRLSLLWLTVIGYFPFRGVSVSREFAAV